MPLIEPAFRRAQEKAWVAGIAEGREKAFREAAEVARREQPGPFRWFDQEGLGPDGNPYGPDTGTAEGIAKAIEAKAKAKEK